MKPLLLLLATAVWTVSPAAGVELAPVFTDGAVLQAGRPVQVWGTGREGEAVTVGILGHAVEATVSGGRWAVTLPPLPVTESTLLRVQGDSLVERQNVAVGEVWICSGQSNMEWRLNQCAPHSDPVLASADNPRIRQLKVPLRAYAGDPLPRMEWKPFDKASAPFFSAVAYHFAAALQQKLDVPVGIVNCAYGGTPIEAWMSHESIQAAGQQRLLDEDARKASAFPTPEAYEEAWTTFTAARKAWDERKKAGVPTAELGPQPQEPYGFRSKSRPGGLRASMLAVVIPYTARGMLWYQGENNAGRAGDYAALLRQFMAACRADWGQPEWPFYIGQLSSPTATFPDTGDAYAIVREAQRATAAADGHSGLVVTLDHGERGNVHPLHKQPVGERFARLALARAYGQTGSAAQSPQAVSARLQQDRVTIAFSDLPGRLVLRDQVNATLEIGPPSGPWVPLRASVSNDGKNLTAGLPSGASLPLTVRYAWRNFCALDLFTDEGLPVSPWSLVVEPAPVETVP